MRRGQGTRAKRSGPARGNDTAALRAELTRVLPEDKEADLRVRYAERQVEQMRKGCIGALSKDQRLSGQRDRTSRAFRQWEARMAWHLREHHGISVEESRSYGVTSYRVDGTYAGPWQLDDLHEQAHGREG
jgi:hypothetical protein